MAKRYGEIAVIDKILRLEDCETLYSFETFNPADWRVFRHLRQWEIGAKSIRGGGPDAPRHGQVFFKTPVKGDVVMAFDARIIPPSYHDLVWFWNVRFGKRPWSAGYLGCLGGWYGDLAGIEKLPDYTPSIIAPSFATRPGRWYHIVSGSMGSVHFIAVNGRLVSYFSDREIPDPSEPGFFGFGFFESHAEYRNLRVYRPKPVARTLKYIPGTQFGQ